MDAHAINLRAASYESEEFDGDSPDGGAALVLNGDELAGRCHRTAVDLPRGPVALLINRSVSESSNRSNFSGSGAPGGGGWRKTGFLSGLVSPGGGGEEQRDRDKKGEDESRDSGDKKNKDGAGGADSAPAKETSSAFTVRGLFGGGTKPQETAALSEEDPEAEQGQDAQSKDADTGGFGLDDVAASEKDESKGGETTASGVFGMRSFFGRKAHQSPSVAAETVVETGDDVGGGADRGTLPSKHEGRIEASQNRIASLQSQLSGTESELQAYKSLKQYSDQDLHLQQLLTLAEKDRQSLRDEITSLLAELKDQQRELTSLQMDSLQGLEQRVSSVTSSTAGTVEVEAEEWRQIHAQRDTALMRAGEMAHELAACKAQVDELQEQLRQSAKEKQEVQATLDKTEKLLKKRETEIERMKARELAAKEREKKRRQKQIEAERGTQDGSSRGWLRGSRKSTSSSTTSGSNDANEGPTAAAAATTQASSEILFGTVSRPTHVIAISSDNDDDDDDDDVPGEESGDDEPNIAIRCPVRPPPAAFAKVSSNNDRYGDVDTSNKHNDDDQEEDVARVSSSNDGYGDGDTVNKRNDDDQEDDEEDPAIAATVQHLLQKIQQLDEEKMTYQVMLDEMGKKNQKAHEDAGFDSAGGAVSQQVEDETKDRVEKDEGDTESPPSSSPAVIEAV